MRGTGHRDAPASPEFVEFEVGAQGQNAFGRVVDTATGDGVFGRLLVSVIPAPCESPTIEVER